MVSVSPSNRTSMLSLLVPGTVARTTNSSGDSVTSSATPFRGLSEAGTNDCSMRWFIASRSERFSLWASQIEIISVNLLR